MKTAFSYWDTRIAPVFDAARQLHIVETESGRIVRETQETLPEDLPLQKTLRLVELGIGTVVCGAISRPMHELVGAYGIEVIAFVAGDLRKVIQAWLKGNVERSTYSMPGCRGHGHRRCCGRYSFNKEVSSMNGKGRSGGMGRGGGGGGGMGGGGGQGGGQGQGQGRGQGQGQGRGGQGRGRMGGPAAGGSGGVCVCPNCGHTEPHQRGVPCVQKQCPKCGTAMIRQ